MGRLTTHILDTASGSPAARVRIDLFAVTGGGLRELASVTTNDDGRCDGPVLEGDAFASGIYELQFHVGDYLRARGEDLPSPAFLDIVPIRFGVASADEHYHVPLLISPYGYSTYRGS
jgi:5-hydroxyisourate hydrolase